MEEEAQLSKKQSRRFELRQIMRGCIGKAMRCVIIGKEFRTEYPSDYAAYVEAEKELESNEKEQAELSKAIVEIWQAKQDYPAWETLLGQSLSVGRRCWDDDILYEAIQAHTAQADWRPSAVPALFKVVKFGKSDDSLDTGDSGSTSEEGSKDNPIAWDIGMTAYNGKYYAEDGVTYFCTRDSGNPLYYKIANLVGLYFVKSK